MKSDEKESRSLSDGMVSRKKGKDQELPKLVMEEPHGDVGVHTPPLARQRAGKQAFPAHRCQAPR